MRSDPTASSLKQIVERSRATPDYFQVRPKGFKAILKSTAEFLETYQVEALILAKLPRGEVWTKDLEQYCQSVDGTSRLYGFASAKEAAAASACGGTIALSQSQDWHGDYFLLILSTSFTGIVLAHRLRATSSAVGSLGEEDIPEDGGSPADLQGGTSDKADYLQVCCSVNPLLIAEVLSGVQSLLEQAAIAGQAIAQQALDRLSALPWSAPDDAERLAMVDKWLVWQFRHQEHLRQSSLTFRRQALTASSLSSQNEVLLNTLRLKDDFLNTVGQELRTPLSTIKTALTLLESPHIKAPQRQRYLDMITHECDRQSALISGVLDLLHTETSVNQARPEPLRLVDTVPPVVSTYQPLAQEKGIMLAYTIPQDLPTVGCPEGWLRQIMIHLLNNSIKYTESGGEVWVTARTQAAGVEIEVRDTGIGISPSDLPKIFDHFYRGRNLPVGETEGAGLGLSIVRQLLMYCGGSIVVSSQPHEGAVFRVFLPFYQQ